MLFFPIIFGNYKFSQKFINAYSLAPNTVEEFRISFRIWKRTKSIFFILYTLENISIMYKTTPTAIGKTVRQLKGTYCDYKRKKQSTRRKDI